jgi:hypothetical protein
MALQSQQFMTDFKVNMTPDTVQIRTASTVNSYGERTFTGGATTYDAYIIQCRRSTTNVEDNLVDVDYIAYIPNATIATDVDSQITLPAPISETRPIVRVNTKRDPLRTSSASHLCWFEI